MTQAITRERLHPLARELLMPTRASPPAQAPAARP